jgi:hypothetical protein
MARYSIKTLFATLLMVGVLAGCAYDFSSSTGRSFSPEYITTFRRGRTTAKQVAKTYGPPQKEIIGKDGGRIWVYYFGKHVERIDAYSGTETSSPENYMESLTVIFNKHGQVRDFSYTYMKFPDPKKGTKTRVETRGNKAETPTSGEAIETIE